MQMLWVRQERIRSSRGFVISAAAHLAVLALLHVHRAPDFVKTVSVAQGHRGTSLVYLAKHGETSKPSPPAVKKRERFQLTHQLQPAPKPPAKGTGDTRASNDQNAVRAGNPYGTSYDGPFSGADVRPALPVHFPDPAVPRSLVPTGIQGDVIVEVTIDAYGNVIDTKLLRGFGYGVDERVVETVRSWRFRPAMRDGVAIASKQDVHYHFPS